MLERLEEWRFDNVARNSSVIEIDQLQVVIYLEEAGLNVSACLELVEKSKKDERVGLPPTFSV